MTFQTWISFVLIGSSFVYLAAHETKRSGRRTTTTIPPRSTADFQQECNAATTTYQRAQRGKIESPSYPKNYPNNLDCKYKIALPKNMQIQLIFREVNLQKKDSSGHCSNDYIRVLDGHASWSKEITTFCGNGTGIVNEPMFSTENKIMIRFVTDNKFSYKGFQVTYDPYQPPKVTDVTQKVTGVVIGTACGLVFLILTFLAICHSRRLSFFHRRDTRSYEITSTGSRDAVGGQGPPPYVDVMLSPEKYPLTTSGPKKTRRLSDSRRRSQSGDDIEDELPPYSELVSAVRPRYDSENSSFRDRYEFLAISRSISTDV